MEKKKKRERERESVRERKKTREEAAAVDRSNSRSYYLRLDLGAFFLSFSMFLSLSFRWGGAIRFRLNVPSSFSLDLGRFSGWFDFAAAHVSQRLFHPLSLSFLFILSFFLSFILSFFHSFFLSFSLSRLCATWWPDGNPKLISSSLLGSFVGVPRAGVYRRALHFPGEYGEE